MRERDRSIVIKQPIPIGDRGSERLRIPVPTAIFPREILLAFSPLRTARLPRRTRARACSCSRCSSHPPIDRARARISIDISVPREREVNFRTATRYIRK